MKSKALVRVVAVLLALLLLPTSAFALTYNEVAALVYNAKEDLTINLGELDNPEGWIMTWADDFGWLENHHGVTITIDGDGRTISGMEILAGVFRIMNATIEARSYEEEWGGELFEYRVSGLLAMAIEGNVIDLTFAKDVIINKPDEDSWLATVTLAAFDGSSLFFQNEGGALGEVYEGSWDWVNDDGIFEHIGSMIEVIDGYLRAHGEAGHIIEHWEDEDGVWHVRIIPLTQGEPLGETRPQRQNVNGIEGSPFHLFKLYANGRSVDAGLYDGDGNKVTFKQRLMKLDGGQGTMFRMRTTPSHDSLALGITVDALRYLLKVGRSQYTVLRVQNGGEYQSPYVDYDVALLLALAEAAGLSGDTMLYLTGPDDDIMIRSADGTLTKL